jgi:hypothetical protein
MSLSQYQMQYQLSPIWLENGIAGSTGAMLPILALINPNAFGETLLDGNPDFDFSDAFGVFQPVVGGSLVEQVPATYPYANLNVAANAIIRNPINVSMIMITPMNQVSSWSVKLNTMTSLKATLDSHNNSGGTYTIMTPAYTYTHMCMLSLTDVSMAQSPIPQNAWRWDFTRPLVTQDQAQTAMNNLMNQITNGTPSIANPTTGTVETTSVPTALGQPASTVNTGIGAGATSPFVSQMPLINSPNAFPFDTTPGGLLPGGGVLLFPAVTQ